MDQLDSRGLCAAVRRLPRRHKTCNMVAYEGQGSGSSHCGMASLTPEPVESSRHIRESGVSKMRGVVTMAACGLAMALACGEGPSGPDESGLAVALAYGESPSGPDESLPAAVATALQATVEGAAERMPPALRGQLQRVQAWNALRAFYRRRGDRPAWSAAGEVQAAAEHLLGALDGLAAEGLDPRLYPRQELESLLAAVRAAASGAAEPPGGASPPDVVTPPGTAASPGGPPPPPE